MSEAVSMAFIFAAVIIVTAVVFCLWAAVVVLKALGRGLLWLVSAPDGPSPISSPTVVCPRTGCRAVNPSSARFCRRCGRELLKHQLSHRAAALW